MMPVDIHGKSYRTVAERIDELRTEHSDYGVVTELVSIDDDRVVMKATILDEKGGIISTGYAEEVRDSSVINRTSALENAETSAVGRALAFYGLAGTEIASADEVASAIGQQTHTQLLEYNNLVRDYWVQITAAKDYLEPKWGENENQSHVTDARAVLKELGDDVHRALWKAPTKGGCFTTAERSLLKDPPEDAL